MAITLDGVPLPDDLIWIDEFGWSPVTQDIKKSLTGSLIIAEATQIKGRPITLESGEDGAWVLRSVLESLQTRSNTADYTMTLAYNGTDYTVRFIRSGNEQPVAGEAVYNVSAPDDEHPYRITIKLFTV